MWIDPEAAKTLTPNPATPGWKQPEYTYGHEQLHIKNVIALANDALRQLVDKVSVIACKPEDDDMSGEVALAQCELAVLEATFPIMAEFRKKFAKEKGHDLNPTPADGVGYPPDGEMPSPIQ
jgi:hypothetical protein